MRDESDVTFTENIHERLGRRSVGHDREIVTEGKGVDVRLPPELTGVGQQDRAAGLALQRASERGFVLLVIHPAAGRDAQEDDVAASKS